VMVMRLQGAHASAAFRAVSTSAAFKRAPQAALTTWSWPAGPPVAIQAEGRPQNLSAGR
jgi:hypothetical protein